MRALDLFAGAPGGWDVAARDLGLDVDGVENMPEAVATREAAGLSTVLDDVRGVLDCIDLSQYDGLIASPPCQSFSTAGKGKGRDAMAQILDAVYAFNTTRPPTFAQLADAAGDERAALVLEPLRVALAMRPTWIAWEQVPTVLPIWRACADVLRWRGYSVVVGNVQAEMFGVPQTRKRAILLARRDGIAAALPTPTHSRYYPRDPKRLDVGVLPWVSMADALGWNHGDLVGFPRLADTPSNGAGDDIVELDGKRYRARDLFPADRPAPVVTGKSRSWQRWLRNGNQANSAERDVDAPAPTVHFGQRQNLVTWQPDAVRVTVQEAAILQSCPADYPWQGSKTKQYLQVGNLIPPLLARAALAAVTGAALRSDVAS